jgi:outer membrane protein
LIGDQLKLREKEVVDLEKNIKTTTSLRFGANGEIKTENKSVSAFSGSDLGAIKTMSEKNGLGIVLDKSNNISVIFFRKYDYTDKVLAILLKGTDKKEKTKVKSNFKLTFIKFKI